MKTLKAEYVIYKQTQKKKYPIRHFDEFSMDVAIKWLKRFRKQYPQYTYVLVKRVITEESLEV